MINLLTLFYFEVVFPISTEPGYSYLFLRFLSSIILASNPVSRYLSEVST